MDECHTLDNQDVKDRHEIYVGCQWFYSIFWRPFDGWASFGLMDQCDTKIDLIMYMYVSDLYFVDGQL